MIEIYLVSHCGKEKSFREKSKALEHADALEKLGYPVKVYLVEQGAYAEIKVLVYMSDSKQVANAYANVSKFETKE